MITNHFVEPYYHFATKEILGLEFFDQDEILNASFIDDIEVGDIYLQYRRPGTDLVVGRTRATEYPKSDLQHLPPFTYLEDLLHPKIGATSNTPLAKAAIRFLTVVSKETHRRHGYSWTELQCCSWYSRPLQWGVRRYGNFRRYNLYRATSKWRDVRNPGYYNRHNGTMPTKSICLKEGYAQGIVAKITREDFLTEYFNTEEGPDRGQVINNEIYACTRTLLGDNHLTKSTANALVGGEINPSQLPIEV